VIRARRDPTGAADDVQAIGRRASQHVPVEPGGLQGIFDGRALHGRPVGAWESGRADSDAGVLRDELGDGDGGDPRQVVLDEAVRCNSDLIALGTKGRTGLAHAFIGSVAEGVIRAASRDVLGGTPLTRVDFSLP